jgi:hypothetical protein
VNRKEIEESTGLYVDSGIGTKKELYRQALSAGEEGSLRGGATRQSFPVPRRAQPIILERRRLEHDDLICIAQNCAHNDAIQSVCCTCFDAPSQIQGGDCRQPGAALRRTLLYRHAEANDLDLGGSQSPF